VTALFYDIVGSTTLLHQLDPEDFGTMQRTLHNEAAAIIRRNSGYLDRVLGDGGCAYFGYPESTEDAAECAVNSALEMVERCVLLEQQSGSLLKLRVGVATGLVVAADTTSTDLPSKMEIIGIAPALASRIQSEAGPNSVAVAESTYRLTSGAFEFERIGSRELKGFAEPVELWRPLARRKLADRFTAYRRTRAPLIGRDDELELCRRRWTRAAGGQGQFLFLHGEAGIGKSRLVSELRQQLSTADVEVIVFQCQPRGNTQPLHPFLDRLRQAITEATGDSEPDRNSVVRFLTSLGADVGAVDAEIVAFLMGGKGKTQAGEAWQMDLTDEEIRARAVEAVLVVLTSSAKKASLIVLEDLHWADTLTMALVARLPEWIESKPVAALITSREPIDADRLGDPNVLAIGLSRLAPEAVSELIRRVWSDGPPDGLAAFVHEKSEGVPLFAEELTLLLKERFKTGVPDRASWEALLREGRILNLQDIIAARLAGLGALRRVAQVASVIGREFGRDLLAGALESEELPATLDDALDRLQQAGIVRRKSVGGSALRFRHVLIQEAAYDSLLKSDRRALHGRIVRLVKSATMPLPDEIMAWHCEQAGKPLKAARHAIRAAEACVARSAVQEADRLLIQAEKQISLLDKEDVADDLRLRLLTVRGPVAASVFGRGGEEARSIYEQGVRLCTGRGDRDRAEWFPLYWGWWFTAPDYETQRARSDILLRDLENSADPEVRLQSLHCAWATNIDAGLHSHCLKCVEEGLRLYDEERARFSRGRYGGHDAKVCGLGERAFSLWFIGDAAGSAESIEAAKQWAAHINHLNSILHALEFEIELKRYQNDYSGTIAVSDRIASLAKGMPSVLTKATLFRAWAHGVSEDAAVGLRDFEAGRDRQRGIATYEGAPIYEGMRAELFERAQRHNEALAILDGAIAASANSGQVFWLAELHRQRALLHHALGRAEETVLADLQRARDVAESQQASALASRAHFDAGRLGLRLQ
jgi:class 3 adenylate cyclase/predicted ATPase